jgi:predicted dehydrogenase
MASDPIRVGIVGASVDRGWGWRSHVPALRALPEFELAAICTAHQETADAAAQATGARHAFSDYRELVACPDIDLIAIAVRVPWHREMALAAIASGKHVYCEWPLGVNLTDVEEMAAAAHGGSVRAMVGLQGRAVPWVQYVAQLLADGYVGRVLTANARLSMLHPYMRAGITWAAKRESGNNLLTIQTAHSLDILSQCLGPFQDVSAQITTMVRQWPVPNSSETVEADAPDCVMVRATTESGAVLSAHFAFVPAHGSGWRLEVFGTDGALVASSGGPPMLLPNRIQGARSGDKELHELAVPEDLIRVPAGYPRDSSFHVAQMYLRLADAIRSGTAVNPNFDDALRLYRLLETLERSDQGGGVLVPTIQG